MAYLYAYSRERIGRGTYRYVYHIWLVSLELRMARSINVATAELPIHPSLEIGRRIGTGSITIWQTNAARGYNPRGVISAIASASSERMEGNVP